MKIKTMETNQKTTFTTGKSLKCTEYNQMLKYCDVHRRRRKRRQHKCFHRLLVILTRQQRQLHNTQVNLRIENSKWQRLHWRLQRHWALLMLFALHCIACIIRLSVCAVLCIRSIYISLLTETVRNALENLFNGNQMPN